MIRLYKESKLSVFSPRQNSTDSSTSSDLFSDLNTYIESKNSEQSEFQYQLELYSYENPVLWVIENEAYCFDVERFSEKLVDATLLEVKKKLSEPKSEFTVFDVVNPLVDVLLNRALNTDGYSPSLKPKSSQSTTLLSLSLKLNYCSSFWPKISEFNIKLGQEHIEQYVNTWKRSYDWLFCIEFLGFESEDCSNVFVYEVEWSKPTKSYPIPQATASVYFALEVYKMVPYDHDRNISVSYIFEGSTLIHKPGKIDFQEKWLQNILDEKLKLFKKMTFSVPAGICGPTQPKVEEDYWAKSLGSLKCSKQHKIKFNNYVNEVKIPQL